MFKNSLLIGMYDTAVQNVNFKEDAAFNQAIYGIYTNAKVNVKFLYLYLITNKDNYLFDRVGVRQKNLSKGYIDNIEIGLPEMEVQDAIINQFEKELNEIQAVKNLMKSYQQKIKDKIEYIWKN